MSQDTKTLQVWMQFPQAFKVKLFVDGMDDSNRENTASDGIGAQLGAQGPRSGATNTRTKDDGYQSRTTGFIIVAAESRLREPQRSQKLTALETVLQVIRAKSDGLRMPLPGHVTPEF